MSNLRRVFLFKGDGLEKEILSKKKETVIKSRSYWICSFFKHH